VGKPAIGRTQLSPHVVAAGAGARSLDRMIHERLRLGIVSALSVNESLTFRDLKKILNTTDGNLSVHSRKLEEIRRPPAPQRIPPYRAGTRRS